MSKQLDVLNEQTVAGLIQDNMFDTAILSTLEDYVAQQAKEGTYDFEANRHLLRIYQFNNDSVKVNVLEQVRTEDKVEM